MAVTDLSAVLVPEIWAAYLSEMTARKSRIIQSGAVVQDSDLSSKLLGGGYTFNYPFWQDLANNGSNVSSDNPASSATPEAIAAAKQVAVRLERNNAWSGMDIAATLAGSDPMAEIARKLVGWWTRHDQDVLVSILAGVLADNVANDAGDLLLDVHEDSLTPTTGSMSGDHVADAMQLLGDSSDELNTIIMHSQVQNTLKKAQLLKWELVETPNAGNVRFLTYLGMRVVIDDGCPVESAIGTWYTSYLMKDNSVAQGEGVAPNPLEQDREALAGDGGGQDILVSRREMSLHPIGYAYTGTSVGDSPTDAELEDAASWDRVFEKKNTGVVFLKTNA